MLNCQEVTRICSDEMERPLRLGERTPPTLAAVGAAAP